MSSDKLEKPDLNTKILSEKFDIKNFNLPTQRIVEVIQINPAYRTYGITASFNVPSFFISPRNLDCLDKTIRPLVEQLLEIVAVKNIHLSRGEIGIEVTVAYENFWHEISPIFIELINEFFFQGQAEVSVSDLSQNLKKQ